MMELYHNHYHWQLAEFKQLSITSVMPETRKERGDLRLDKSGTACDRKSSLGHRVGGRLRTKASDTETGEGALLKDQGKMYQAGLRTPC